MGRVIFVQLPPPRFSFQDPPTNIPLGAGFLVSALTLEAKRDLHAEIVEPEIVDVLADSAICKEILRREPAVLAMTLYVWNVERSLFLASNVKRSSPTTKVLVGGPEVTPDNAWVLEHPAVDVAVFGEGESRIGRVLKAANARRGVDSIPGTAAKDRRGVLRLNTESPEPWDLATCSYPYLDGKVRPSRDGTLFLETMRGCPFKCRYCYYHKAFARTRFHPENSLAKVLDFAYGPSSLVREVYLMDPTFNARKGFRKLLRSMERLRGNNDYPRLHTELRADLLDSQDVALFRRAGLASAEIGLQTVNSEVLRAAGRKGDPEKIAHGVDLLKKAGIEVTTGIIVGLPKDTPEGFSRTLRWLKKKEAYTVVHPFVLSVLPGTDFRARSEALGLRYNSRPPYFVRSTPTFPEEELKAALLECEQVFDMEMDYIVPPSLVDSGPEVLSSPESAPYISKWIVRPDNGRWREVVSQVVNNATDPFTLWFRGAYDPEDMLFILREFADANPHAVVHVVLELNEPPPPEFFDIALQRAGNPELFLNRYYEPLYGEGEVININFHVILLAPGSRIIRRKMLRRYDSIASVIWDSREFREERLDESERPLLISWVMDEQDRLNRAFGRLKELHGDRPEEVLFRNPEHATAWRSFNGEKYQDRLFVERIFIT